MQHIALFASGNGSNVQNICTYFKSSNNIKISLILTNNKNAYVIERAKLLHIPCIIFSKNDIENPAYFTELLQKHNIHWIVLAGFLLKIPEYLIKLYPKSIINIHPALLPKYGGKGMYGDNVHKMVILNKEKESGITIHYVNEKYDEGEIIFQAKTAIESHDTYETLAQKVHTLEYTYYPKVLQDVFSS